MNIVLTEIEGPGDFRMSRLRKRAEESAKSDKTKLYKAVSDGRELAFLALDRWPEINVMVINEIFVAKYERRKGIGTALLRMVEKMCFQENMAIIRVHPLPFEKNLTEKELLEWYYNRGYIHGGKVTGILYKVLTIWPDKIGLCSTDR